MRTSAHPSYARNPEVPIPTVACFRHPRRATPKRNADLVEWYCLRYHQRVVSVDKIVSGMKNNPKNVRYEDLNKFCEHYFGPPRTTSGSHAAFKTPWPGDPRVNIQNDKGKAKPYQVRQVLAAIDKKEAQ